MEAQKSVALDDLQVGHFGGRRALAEDDGGLFDAERKTGARASLPAPVGILPTGSLVGLYPASLTVAL